MGATTRSPNMSARPPPRASTSTATRSTTTACRKVSVVIQPPGAVTPAHFHDPNQFQVFVEGEGRIGAHPVSPVTVQYANGHTPYGPIVASRDRGRVFHAAPALGRRRQVLPASRDKLVKGNQRARVKSGLARPTTTIGCAPGAAGRSRVLEAKRSGLAGSALSSWSRALPVPCPIRADRGGAILVWRAWPWSPTARAAYGRPLARRARLPRAPANPALDLLVLEFPVVRSS